MTAAFLSDNYTSRTESPANKAKISKILEYVQDGLLCDVGGDRDLTFSVNNGAIQDVSLEIARWSYKEILPAKDADFDTLKADLESLLEKVLVLGWSGSASLSWTRDMSGHLLIRCSRRQKFS